MERQGLTPLFRLRAPVALVAFVLGTFAIPPAAAGNPSCGAPAAGSAPAAIAAAEATMALALERGSLWTVAVDALARGRAALESGACEEAIREAEAARALAQLGLDQLDYPPYQLP
jgi:hypothetical protein